MEYTVIKDFFERGTLDFYRAGGKYACPDPVRANLLISRGYLAANEEIPEEMPEKAEPEPEEKPEKPAKPQKAASKRSTKTKKA